MSRILVVTNVAPWPPTTGSAQRTNLLMRALRQHGDVDLFLVNQHGIPDGGTMEVLRAEHGLLEAATPWDDGRRTVPARLRRWVRSRMDKHAAVLDRWEQVYASNPEISRRLDAVLANGRHDLVVGRYLRPTVASGATRYRPLMLDIDDVDFATWESRLDSPATSGLARLQAIRAMRRLRAIVEDRIPAFDHVWVTKTEDMARIPARSSSVLPNIPFPRDGGKPIEACQANPDSRSLLWVGSLNYPVNVRAVDRFLESVWPRIRSARPDAAFRIVGTGMNERQRSSWSRIEGVIPIGFAEDLRAEYERCLFAVAPVFEGGGTKIKVLEALLHGRTVVATAHACRGFEDVLPAGRALLVARDEDELTAHCIELLQRPGTAAALATAGRAVVRTEYTFDRFSRTVSEAVRPVLERRSASRIVRA